MATRVTIVEDNIALLEGLVAIIDTSDKFMVANTYTTAENALKNVLNDDPEIILMDIGLPGMNGVQGTKAIKRILPKTNVIIVTVYENSEMVFDALCAGATGYLTKNLEPDELMEALQECVKGGAPMSTKIARMVVHSFKRNENTLLSERETEILRLLSSGMTYASMGQKLFLSMNTIKFHIKNIYIKLQVSCREMAIKKANEDKLI